MIAVTLTEPTVAIVEERYDLDRAHAYSINMNVIRDAISPGSVWWGAGHPDTPKEPPESGMRITTYHLYVSPAGFARMERFLSYTDDAVPHVIETVTDNDHAWFYISGLPPDDLTPRFRRNSHDQRPSYQTFNDGLGLNYPNEALALLNPVLVMWDYVAQVGSQRPTTHLGRTTTTHRLNHHPERPINATDDPERLGSFHVEAAMTNDDPPILLEWSALHRGEPFRTTRVTWLRQGVELDPVIFTDPRIPAPSLPFE